MRVAYFDCFAGASGDMTLGALVDAGADPEALRKALAGLGLGREFELRFERVRKGALAATKARVDVLSGPAHAPLYVSAKDHAHPGRHLGDVLGIVARGGLAPAARERAEAIFRRLAEAEAAVHGTTTDHVHFHEVGAVDAIVDVCGAVVGLDLLGIEAVHVSELTLGRGVVRSAHGELPAPAPAVLELCKGAPTRTRDVGHELLTPTGAAILTTLAKGYGAAPDLVLGAIGYGAGDADFEGFPNVLRVLVGETNPAAAAGEEPNRCVVLETNIDDASPQVVGYAIDRLLAAGALDAFAVPCSMKKSRPGTLLVAIARDADTAALEAVFFRETTTFGVRRHAVSRTALEREVVRVVTPHGDVGVKIGRYRGALVSATPEYEDCRRIAAASGVPLKTVQEAAQRAATVVASR